MERPQEMPNRILFERLPPRPWYHRCHSRGRAAWMVTTLSCVWFLKQAQIDHAWLEHWVMLT
jgi:hypothetical protein